MAAARKNTADRKTLEADRFDIREVAGGAWEVFDPASSHAIQVSGIPLSRITREEALGAIHMLREEAITPDRAR